MKNLVNASNHIRTVILISDGLPHADGGGISQTLFNLFNGWEGRIVFIDRTFEQVLDKHALKAEIIKYRFEKFRYYSNRVFKRLNRAILIQNFNWQQIRKNISKSLPPKSDCFVLVSTSEPIKIQFAWLLQERFGYMVLPYFMDDWMGGLELKWRGNNIQDIVADLLRKAPCRLMISYNLERILSERYGLPKKPVLVVHNPAPKVVDESMVPPFPDSSDKTIIYAGSIWAMHLSALYAASRAVQLLHQKGMKEFKLLIYTSEAAWNHNRKKLDGPGVEYGGFIPYEQIQKHFQNGWLLLVTASFEAQYAYFTNSSVQTKLTDYMAAGKPLLYIGPEEGASGQFVHEWECGFTIGTNKPTDIAAQMEAIASMPELCQRKANNGLNAAKGYFRKETVQERLYKFLYEYVK